MEIKVCTRCGVEKTIDNFRKYGKYYRSECKECSLLYSKEYRLKNKEKVREYNRQYRETNKETLKRKQKEYAKKYYQRKKEYVKFKSNEYYYSNIEIIKGKQKEYRMENKDKLKEYSKKYQKENKKLLNEYQKKYNLEKRKNDSKYKLKCQIRHLLNMSFTRKGKRKSQKLEEIVGCSIGELILHLISTFEENYNEKWRWVYLKNVHIDHKTPLATAKSEEDVIKLCHYTNLQLLKSKDNLEKRDKLDWRLKS